MLSSAAPAVHVAQASPHRETVSACLRIANALPEYFNAAALVKMPEDVRSHRLYLADRAGTMVGFATVSRELEGVAELTWLAADPRVHRRGIGTALVSSIAEDCRSSGCDSLIVKTVAEEANYPPYEPTRRFYEKVGFMHLETIDPYSPWGGCACAIYGMDLSDAGRGIGCK